MKGKGRLYSLDYLRGLAAFGIMIYHYLSWNFGQFPPDSFMGRVGLYGVSVFYVLSGLTLYFVYFEKMTPTVNQIISFFRKRIFRIFPLLWLVTLTTIVLQRKVPDFVNLFLNLSGLFGFIRWDKYFATGAWSIGNELVFYCFFPIFIWFLKKHKLLMWILSSIVLLIYIYIAFVILNPLQSLESQWKNYVNPFNQLFLFLGGILIGYFFRSINFPKFILAIILILGFGIFIFYPVVGQSINLVTEFNRIVFTIACFMICVGFYKLTIQLPAIVHKPLTLLGEASYSVYLLHPIIWNIVSLLLKFINYKTATIPTYVIISFSVILTLICSYFVYQYFEKFFMRLGGRKKVNSAKG